MLIIFDLDDTLIDTSGSIIPGLLRNALQAMQKKGLEVSDFDRTYQRLLHFDRNHPNSRSALLEFLEIYGAPQACYDEGIREVYEQPIYSNPIQPIDDAIEVLHELAESYQLALVTKGKEHIQKEKMRRAKIPIKLFRYLCFCEEGPLSGPGKKGFYESIGREIGISPSQVLVCGDRISIDLTPAKELGYKTVQMRWGRGLGNTGLKKDVDYTILHLNELGPIAKQVKNMS